jgi:hypothetical protein
MSKDQLTPPNIHAITAKWRKFPLKNPYNDNEIILSVNPKSDYVVLYKKVINELISQIIIDNTTTDKSHKYQLTIKDCKFIKNALPDKHAIIEVSENNIKYDHLFTKYFIKKEQKYNYDQKYKEDIDIYLYLNVYNAIIKKLKPFPPDLLPESISRRYESYSFSFGKEYGVIEDLLKNNMNINKSELSISKLIERLCNDIKKLLYAHSSKITKNDYNIVLNNIKILDYASSIYKICEIKDLVDNENKMIDYFTRLFKDKSRLDPENDFHFIDNIFLQIIITLTKTPEDISLYRAKSIIQTLYDDDNQEDLQTFLKRFERKSYEDILIILQKIYKKVSYIYDKIFKGKEEEKLLTLNPEYKEIILDRNYKFATIYTDSISSSKSSSKSSDRESSSSSKSSSREISSKSSSSRESSSSSKDSSLVEGDSKETKLNEKLKKKCGKKWSDSISLNSLSELTYKEKKYMTFIRKFRNNDIINKDTIYNCHDTVALYNQIVSCINKNIKPFIPLTKELLTEDEIEKICDNVSKITKNEKHLLEAKIIKKKYNSLINDNSFLKLRTNNDELNEDDEIGIIKIHLFINFDDEDGLLQFPLFNKEHDITKKTKNNFPNLYNIRNSEIIRLPKFNWDIIKDDRTNNLIDNIIDAFEYNKLLYNVYFPYRKPNWKRDPWNSILTLPEFSFDIKEHDAEMLYAKVLSYDEQFTRMYF